MPRTSRSAAGGVVYHVLNRGNGRMSIFRKPGDYLSFLQLLLDGKDKAHIELFGFCLMTAPLARRFPSLLTPLPISSEPNPPRRLPASCARHKRPPKPWQHAHRNNMTNATECNELQRPQ